MMDPLEMLKVAGPIATALALLLVVRQLRGARAEQRAAQSWREQEFWAAQIAAIKADPAARVAMQLLDRDGGRFDLFPHDPDPQKRFWVVTHGELAQALRPHRPEGERLEEVEARIRNLFDDFLDHFEQLDRFAEKGLVERKALLPYLADWFDAILSEGARLEDPDTLDPALLRYIDHYGFEGTKRLLQAYEAETAGAATSKLALPPYVAPPGGHRGWRIAREERKARELQSIQTEEGT